MPTFDPSLPDFNGAVKQLRGFLTSQGLANEVQWIFREEVVWPRKRLYVKLPLSAGNFDKARSTYEDGLQNDLGIRIEVLGVLNEVPLCDVWLPEDESQAEENGLLMAKFFISIPKSLQKLRSVSNRILWHAYKLCERDSDWRSNVDRLPNWKRSMALIVFGGASCPVMGAVFKTVCEFARARSGGFDSHTPPPEFSWQ